jgi:hypothetical protein
LVTTATEEFISRGGSPEPTVHYSDLNNVRGRADGSTDVRPEHIRASSGHRYAAYDSRATITTVRAACATAVLTEPSSMPANPPRP